MAVTASLKMLRMTPRKMRVVAAGVRGKNVQHAVDFLNFCRRRAARPLLKLIRSAVASADKKGGIDLDNLYIRELLVDAGPTMRRWMPRARGMATPVLKRTCKLKVVLDER